MAVALLKPKDRIDTFIPVSEPWLSEAELSNVNAAVRSGWISSAGEFIDRFERDWAAYCGRAHGVAVSNGTTALQLAVRALDLQPGDEVIMPSFTIISCALALVEVGVVPVPIDCDALTWTMDIAQIEAAITPRTRAIMAVHIYGHPVDMDGVMALARKHNLRVIEDAAEAHGAECLVDRDKGAGRWQRCGSFGDITCFSFYANKIVTTGEGGMVLADDPVLAERVRQLRNLCFGKAQRFRHEELGFNYRITNVQAAIGVAQVARIGELVQRKRSIARRYLTRLSSCAGLQLPVEESWARNVYWMFALVLRDAVPFDAAELTRRLRERNIETRPFFVGMHEQPALHKRGVCQGKALPVTERIAARGLYLPSGMTLHDDEVDRVCDAVIETLR